MNLRTDQRKNYLSLILLDALEDENESDINFILGCKSNAIDPSYVPLERGISPLHYVCGMQNEALAIDVAKRFLNMGADPNCRTEDNVTPLHVAAMHGRENIVCLLLEYGANMDVYDNDQKTPALYAIDECNFEVLQVMKDFIFLTKYEKKKATIAAVLTTSRFEDSLKQRTQNNKSPTSTPHSKSNKNDDHNTAKNKNLLKINSLEHSFNNCVDRNKFTPNRVHYNYDVTSPYYINITHRRHKPQPKFPDINFRNFTENNVSNSTQNVNVSLPEAINIFSLTKENLKELTQRTGFCEKSRPSLIESWREKVQKSRCRKSIVKQYGNMVEIIDRIENDHLEFTNIELKQKSPVKEAYNEHNVSSFSSSHANGTHHNIPIATTIANTEMNLNNVIQGAGDANIEDYELKHFRMAHNPPQQNSEIETSYKTAPEHIVQCPNEKHEQQKKNPTTNPIRSPINDEYFLQMAEAYVHTDDENGLIFYETKFLSNVHNKLAIPRNYCETLTTGHDFDTTMTSRLTNITLPLDYETDTLRAELAAFGDPPGPITKTTKKLYIKKLMKYKRKVENMQELPNKKKKNNNKFSVELERTLKSEEDFQRIENYFKYDAQSMEYFDSSINKKKMREGHLKQSFIYMLIDPRISSNLPGESMFLKEFDVWQRFLKSIFYVGKGKTSRPYSHLYAAIKKHSSLQNKEPSEKCDKQFNKISNNKKLDRILNIWANGYGVVCLHVFHNILPTDAYTREAAIIDALSVHHLTNCKRGDYYGPSKMWTMKEKKFMGISLLFKSMRMYLAEGESQLSPSDLI